MRPPVFRVCMDLHDPPTREVPARSDYQQSILDTVRDPMLVLDKNLRIRTVSRAFCRMFQVSVQETEGRLIYELGNGQWNIPRLREFLEVILPERTSLENFEVQHDFPKIGTRVMLLNARKIWREANNSELMLLAIEDITDRRKLEQEANRANELYARLLASSRDCIKLLDLDGMLLSVSENGRKVLEIEDLNSVLGSCWVNFWSGDDHAAASHAIEEARNGRASEFEGFFATGSGAPHWWHVAVSPVMDGGKPEFILAVSRDITQRKQHEEAMLQVQLELTRSNEDLSKFADIASHDLRAPLSTMVQYSQLLVRRNQDFTDPQSREILDFIVKGGRRMSQMLDDMLRYAEMSRKATQPGESVSLAEACSQATQNLNAAICESRAVIECIIADDICVRTDIGLLMQLIQNLMKNAIDYRREDKAPKVTIHCKPEGPNWLLSVTDNGIGIEEKQCERIFQPFIRLHGEERPGTGIGLASCKRMVERIGGRIWVQSTPGHGSTFFVLLPKA